MTNTPTAANRVPRSDTWMVEEFAQLRRDVDELRNARTLESASMSAGMLVLSGGAIQTQDFDGNVETGTPGTAGFALGGVTQGNAVANTLTPKDRLISNDALMSPVDGGQGDGTTQGLLLPATDAPLHTETILVPAGFTKAFVLGVGLVGGQNPSSSVVDVVSARVAIADQLGDNVLTHVPPNQVGHSVAFFATTVDNLVDSFDVAVLGFALSGTFDGATARVSAFVIFVR